VLFSWKWANSLIASRKLSNVKPFLCSMVLLTGHAAMDAQGDGGAKKTDPAFYGR
jgi:hypothetical protein